MSTPKEKKEKNAVETPIFDPFPEPSGYPSGWDLNGLTPPPAPAPATPTTEDTEA